MKRKSAAISLVLALIITLLPMNMITAFGASQDAPDYIHAYEEGNTLFVYWQDMSWSEGDDEDDWSGLSVDYYEVYCKAPGDSDYRLTKKVDAHDDEYQYYNEDEDGEFFYFFGFNMPVTERGYYEFKVRAHFDNDYEGEEEVTPYFGDWTYGSGIYLNLEKPVVTATITDSSQLQLSWEPVPEAEGYYIFRGTTLKGDGGDYNYFDETTGNTATTWIDKKAKPGTKYYYYITAYKTYFEFNHQGPRSSKVSATIGVLKQKISKLSTYSKKVSISWTKDSAASGYEVYRSTRSGSGYSRITTIKSNTKTSYIDSGKTAGKKYYYKVRAYKYVNGKKITGPYSDQKSITVSSKTVTQQQARRAYLKLRNDSVYFPSTLIVNNIYSGTIKGEKVIMIDYSAENAYGIRSRSYFTYQTSNGYWNHDWYLSSLKSKTKLNKYYILHW